MQVLPSELFTNCYYIGVNQNFLCNLNQMSISDMSVNVVHDVRCLLYIYIADIVFSVARLYESFFFNENHSQNVDTLLHFHCGHLSKEATLMRIISEPRFSWPFFHLSSYYIPITCPGCLDQGTLHSQMSSAPISMTEIACVMIHEVLCRQVLHPFADILVDQIPAHKQGPWHHCFFTLLCSLSPHLQKILDLPFFCVSVSSVFRALPPSYFLGFSVLTLGLSLYEIALAQSTQSCEVHHLSLGHKPWVSRGLGSVHSCIANVMPGIKERFVHLLSECNFQSI